MAVVDLRDELPRADWSEGVSPKSSITVHWNGTPLPDDVSDLDVIFGDANYHVSKDWSPAPGIQGGDGIMYHRLYGRDGTVYLTRDPGDVLWHSGSTIGNLTSEAWQVMVGEGESCTPAQLAALRRDLAADGRAVFPHQFWSATQCPGPELTAALDAIKEGEETPMTPERYAAELEDLVKATVRVIVDAEFIERIKAEAVKAVADKLNQ